MRYEFLTRLQVLVQNAEWAAKVAHHEGMASHEDRYGTAAAAEAHRQAAERYRLLLTEPIPGFDPPKLPAGDDV